MAMNLINTDGLKLLKFKRPEFEYIHILIFHRSSGIPELF